MIYNQDKFRYELAYPLKQGVYNYSYVIQGENGIADFTPTEGQHMETENDYTLLIYHKNQIFVNALNLIVVIGFFDNFRDGNTHIITGFF